MATENFTLAELQGWMQQMITGNGNCAGPDQLNLAAVNGAIHTSSKLSAARHLGIYKGSYIARLRECMRNQFAALAHALGNELFEAFTDQYLEAHPSQSYTLNDLGGQFAAFLEATRPDAHEEHKETWPDFMIELARFEYALSLIFDEHADESALTATETIPDEELVPAPVFHLFHHRFPICNYYLEFNQKKAAELPFPADSYCVVIRTNYRLGLFVIKPAQYEFLRCFSASRSVEIAKQELTAKFGFARTDVDAIWLEWRKLFITSGFFVCR